MFRVMLVAFMVLLGSFLYAQTVLWTEDFEDGSTDWTILNGTLTNKWTHGTAVANGGTHSMYISNNDGTSNAYTVTTKGVVHFYRDIAFPADAFLSLSFNIRCSGENNSDFVRVYVMPNTTTPVASISNFWTNSGTDPHNAYRLGSAQYNSTTLTAPSGGWNPITLNIPNTWAGATGRLVFSWINDDNTGNQPPAAIDNITISYQSAAAPPLPVTLVSPQNNASFVPSTTSISWANAPNSSTPTSYTVYLSTQNPPTTPGDVVTQTSYTPATALNPETTYYWRVVPSNEHGTPATESCPVWSFTTVTNNLVIIGSGNTPSKYAPINMYSRYSISQSIYLESEISDILPGSVITSIDYRYTNTSNQNLNEYVDVYIGHTNLNGFANTGANWIPFSGLTHVYQGPLTAQSPASYATIALNLDPFVYNGGNIVVAVTELVSNSNQNNHYNSNWIHSDLTSQYRTLTLGVDSPPNISNPPSGTRYACIANTRFTFLPPSGSNLFLQPSALTLDNISQNIPTTRDINFVTTGVNPVTISAITGTTGFSTTQQIPFTIQPGSSQAVSFTILTTTLTSPFSGTITVTSDAGNGPTHTATITVTNVHPENMLEISGGTSTLNRYVPSFVSYRYNYTQSIYLANEINRPTGHVITQIQYHYNAIETHSQTVTIYMGHTTLTAIPQSNLIPYNTLTQVFNGPFSLSTQTDPQTGGYWVNITLDQPFSYDSTQNLVIAFLDNEGGAFGSYDSQFYHKTTSGASRSAYIHNDGSPYDINTLTTGHTRIQSVPNIRMFWGPPITGPYITLSPRSIYFANAGVGSPSTASLSIRNIGIQNLIISGISLPANMQISQNAPITLTPGDATTVTLTLTPSFEGSYSGNVIFNSNAANEPTVTVFTYAQVLPENLVLVGNGTLENQGIPFEPSYRYSYSQSIYPTTDLVGLTDGVIITHIGYQTNGHSAFSQNVKVYMGYTNQNSFTNFSSYIPASDLTLVYNGPITVQEIAGSWAMLPLSEPFVYNASQNLVVAVNEYQGGAYQSGSDDLLSTNRSTQRSITMYNDNTSYDELNLTQIGTVYTRNAIPNTAFVFEPGGLPRPRGLNGTAGYGSVSLSWIEPNIPTEDDPPSFLGYAIYRNAEGLTAGLPFETTQYTDYEVTSGSTYTYYITAIYVEGESEHSNTIQVTIPTTGLSINPPTNLVAHSTQGRVPISWQPGVVVINESFETALGNLWLRQQGDSGDGAGWTISPTGGIDGDGYIYSSSVDHNGDLLYAVQDYLISPVLSITATGTWLNYWVGAFDASSASETYWLMIASPPTSNAMEFQIITNETLTDHNWQRRSVNLSQYAGSDIRIAFAHITLPNASPNRNRIKLDGFEIVKPNDGSQSLPLAYRVYLDDNPNYINGNNYSQTNFLLPLMSLGTHRVYVTAVYDQAGNNESTLSNVAVITYTSADADYTSEIPTTRLVGNYPNPFNPSTTIAFEIDKIMSVSIDIYNAKGQLVRTLSEAVYPAGRHTLTWNGNDDSDQSVSSGIYFYRLTTEKGSDTRKMLLLK